MFDFLRKRTAPSRPAPAAPRRSHTATARPAFEPEFQYPPVDPGLPAVEVADIVQSQAELIGRLRRAVSCDDATFRARYLSPIEAVARYVHLLPASAGDAFAGPGGLFRLCLEIGFFCAQAADGRIYTPTADVETRHKLEPRYKYATFLAGLTCELYRPLAAAIITDRTGRQWPKFLGSLEEWLVEHGVDRYYVSWQNSGKTGASGAEGAAVIGAVLPKDELAWLDAGTPQIVREVHAVALGRSRPGDSILGDVVEAIRRKVLQHDQATRRSRYGRLRVGHHLEVHLIDGLRELVADGVLRKSADGGLWYGTDGLYLEWPAAAPALLALLDKRGLAGLPRHPLTIAEVLGQAELLVPADGGSWMWTILTGSGKPGEMEKRTALRVREPVALLGYVELQPEARPYAEYLVGKSAEDPGDTQQAVAQLYTLPIASEPAAPSQSSLAPSVQVDRQDPPVGERSAGATDEPEPAHRGASARPRPIEEAGNAAHRRGQVPAGDARPAPPQAQAGESAAAFDAQRPPSPAMRVKATARQLLSDSEAEMIGRWIDRFRSGRTEAVIELPGRAIAISQDTLIDDDLEIGQVVLLMDKQKWLGSIPNAARGVRVGDIPFGDGKKPGFVLHADAASLLGFHS